MPAHRIRLRGPWECEPLSRLGPGELPPPRTMTLPCRWDAGGLTDFAGRVRYRRRFGTPTNLGADECVWLTFEGADSRAEAWLNGERLGEHSGEGAFDFAISQLLISRNELVVEVESENTSGGLWGEVALEIRSV
jgi:beta-mannosidase